MTRNEIVAVFNSIADIMQIKGDEPSKVKIYRNLAITLSYALPDEIQPPFDQSKLPKIQGIGPSTLEKIAELVDTGKCTYYENLKSSIPSGVLDLLLINGVGPSTAGKLYNELGIDSLSALQKAIDEQKLHNLKGMGKKTEENIKQGLSALMRNMKIRLMGYVLPTVESIIVELINEGITASIVGDLRRRTETIKEAIILAISTDWTKIQDDLKNIKYVEEIYPNWNEKGGSAKISGDVELKVILTNPQDFGLTLILLTGSEAHLEGLNQIGFKQNIETYKNKTEEEIYAKLKLPFIAPELREGLGEIESALSGKLPDLIELNDIKGDLHIHSNWSDGHESVETIAEFAKKIGYEYICISDHSISSKIANGLDVERILNKMIEVREINQKIDGIEILMGAEVDILKDGRLDYPNNILEKLDVVIASVHSGFNMSESEMTKRIIKAVENEFVHIIGHLTGRLLGKRDPYEVNIDAVIDAVAENKKSFEINAYPDRLDLKDIHIRKAKDKGILLTINTDAHSISDLSFMKYGIYTARRGWLEKKDVLNTKTLSDLMVWLRRKI
ncbi:MAG: DNA polymerase/3'-5' exonuclease PolX [Candidatus Poribacteria bacterium]